MTDGTVRQPSKKQLVAAARRRWGEADVDFDPHAPDAERRKEWSRLNQEGAERKKEIDADLALPALKAVLERLTSAAKFVCDVDGDPPSIDELERVLVDAERLSALKEERAEIESARRARHPDRYRWRVRRVNRTIPGLPYGVVVAQADTAAALMALIVSPDGERGPS